MSGLILKSLEGLPIQSEFLMNYWHDYNYTVSRVRFLFWLIDFLKKVACGFLISLVRLYEKKKFATTAIELHNFATIQNKEGFETKAQVSLLPWVQPKLRNTERTEKRTSFNNESSAVLYLIIWLLFFLRWPRNARVTAYNHSLTTRYDQQRGPLSVMWLLLLFRQREKNGKDKMN